MLRPWMGKLYVQVLIGIFVGLLVGLFAPNIAVTLQPLADGFIKLIKMLLAPIIFATVVSRHGENGQHQGGRTHRRSRSCVFRDHVDPSARYRSRRRQCCSARRRNEHRCQLASMPAQFRGTRRPPRTQGGIVHFFMDIIPTTIVDAFAKGSILQIIFISILMGIALVQLGERGKPLVDVIELAAAVAISHCRHGDAAGADRRRRWRCLHYRALRRGLSLGARLADAICLRYIVDLRCGFRWKRCEMVRLPAPSLLAVL